MESGINLMSQFMAELNAPAEPAVRDSTFWRNQVATAASIKRPNATASVATHDGEITSVALAGAVVLLCGLVLLTWSASMNGSFQFDDYGAIVNDSKVRQLWPLNDFITHNRPIGLYTLALNFAAGELSPTGYHAVNLLIHLTSAIMLLFLVRDVLSLPRFALYGWTPTETLWTAWCCSAVWGVHPLTTQAVTYIVQRYESLAALCGLLVLFAQSRIARGYSWWIVPACLAALCGTLSKEPMALIPFIALAFDHVFLKSSRSEPINETDDPAERTHRWRWPFYLAISSPWLWFAPSVSRWLIPAPSRNSGMGFNLKAITPWEYLRTEPEVLLNYLQLSFWPDKLCFDYGWQIQDLPGVYLPLGGVILAIVALGFWWTFQRRATGFLLLAPLLYLAPTSSFVPVFDPAVEHRMYLPLTAIVTGMVCSASLLTRLYARHRQIPPALIAAPLMCLIILPLSWRTHLRNLDYHSGVALWTDTIAKRPQNPRAHYCLGLELRRLGKTTEAQAEFATAVDIGIPVAEFHVALADGQRAQGQSTAAITNYRKAIRLKPGLPQAHNGLGATLHSEGRLEDARTAFEAATELNLPQARYNLAAVLIDLGDEQAAVPLLKACLAAHPQFERPARRLAWIYATSANGSLLDGELALQVLAEHLQMEESGSPYVWDTYAAALARVGRFNEASEAARRAMELAAKAERDELHDRIKKRLLNYDSGRAWQQAKENQS